MYPSSWKAQANHGNINTNEAFLRLHEDSCVSRWAVGTKTTRVIDSKPQSREHLWKLLQLHNRDIDHQVYGNWGIHQDQEDLPLRHTKGNDDQNDEQQQRHLQTVSDTVWIMKDTEKRVKFIQRAPWTGMNVYPLSNKTDPEVISQMNRRTCTSRANNTGE